MEILIIWIFFIIGICFWSFSTVLIERWHSGKWGILLWRSECPHCHHKLSIWELFPIFSYMLLGWKCAHCKRPISLFYPIAEVSMGLLFSAMAWIGLRFGYFPTDIVWWILISWGFITGIYILYDLRFMEIPDQIMVPGIYWTILLLVASIYLPEYTLSFDLYTYDTFHTFLIDHISWAVILYSFLYLQILIPWGLFLLKKKDIKSFISLCLHYFLLPILLIFPKKKEETQEAWEIPTWVWWWDLRIALFIGLTLWSTHGIASFFFAYIIGSFFWIGILIARNIQKEKSPRHEIPFWPFLWIGWLLSLLFYNDILLYITI